MPPDNSLPVEVRRLMAARGARSLGQGALFAAFTLYLHAMNWTAPEIGATLSAALLVGAVFTMVVGPASDRRGRKRYLLIYEAVQAVAALLALVTAWPPALALAAIVGGFGRGAGGSAGPFAPLEQAWLANALPAHKRGAVFSLNAAIGFLGMAAGAFITGGVHFLISPLGNTLAYRPLFLVSFAGSVSAFWMIAGLHETPPVVLTGSRPVEYRERRQENRMLARLVIANTVNGMGIGMIAPLIAYWFALRFQHGPGSIGPALSASFLLGGTGSVLVARLAQRYGLIRPVIILRGIGFVLLLLVPLMPQFGLSAALFAVRTGVNQGTAGVRQALVAGLTRERRGLAASLQNVSIQVPRAVGPLISGFMLHAGMLKLPFFIAAFLQLAYVGLYARFFRGYAEGGVE